MTDQVLKELNEKLENTLSNFQDELASIHTGRASVSLVDNIMIESYGTKQPIKAVASITIPEPRSIVIQAWDRSNLSLIENAIRDSDLHLNPVNTGENIRINLPELTQERRAEFVKIAKQKAEEARISIRNSRSDAVNGVRKDKNDGKISEDEMFRMEQDIQKNVDKYNQQIEEIFSQKEKELLTI